MSLMTTTNGKHLSTMATMTTSPLIFKGGRVVKQLEFEDEVRRQLVQAGLISLKDVRKNFCVFDLSESYWYDLGWLLWLISMLHTLRKQENVIQLIFPEPDSSSAASNLWDFLIRWRFFETLLICVDDPVNLLKPQQVQYMSHPRKYLVATGKSPHGGDTILHTLNLLEITTIRAGQEGERSSDSEMESLLSRFHDKLIEKALNRLCGWDESVTTAFKQRVVREGIRNSVEHSHGSFATIAMRLDEKNLTLAIADNGVGIPQTLRAAFKKSGVRKDLVHLSDVELIKLFTMPDMILDSRLIRLALEKGISSRPDVHAGDGLYYLKSLVLSQGGELRIRSGKACVDFTDNKETPYDDMLESPGTVIRILTPLKLQ